MLSIRGYARHRREAGLLGGTHRAVQQAIAEGRITLAADGRLDPQVADQQWAAHTAPRVFAFLPPAGRTATWTPTEAQAERWRAQLHELQRADRALGRDWERLGQPNPPTGSPQLDGFVWAWGNVTAAITQLQVALGLWPVQPPDAEEAE